MKSFKNAYLFTEKIFKEDWMENMFAIFLKSKLEEFLAKIK